jgi:hypothetical protein
VPDHVKVSWNGASQRVITPYSTWTTGTLCCAFHESGCLRMQPKMGGKFHLRLNTGGRPIANKYREGKMKRTLERESNSM